MHKRIVSLDVLRGLAIGLVLLRHAWPEQFGSAGIVGVVVFFALSGYLITGVLLSDLARNGHVSYKRFYRNRALRLLPPLVLLLVGIAIVTLLADPLGERDGLLRALVIAVTYTGNLPIELGSSTIDHLWTLATEEQFYLVWPLILAFAVKRGKVRRVFVATALLVLLAMVATIILVAPETHRVYRLPTSWALAMIIGAAGRVGQVRMESWLPRSGAARGCLGTVALVATLLLALLPEGKGSVLSYLVLGPIVATLTVILIQLTTNWATIPSPWMNPLVWLGTISYAAYLWNYPVTVWLHAVSTSIWVPTLTVALTLAASTVSWWIVERPAQIWKRRLDARERVRKGQEAGAVEGGRRAIRIVP
jgi:peptidoglycan/LPS O-acetylase OafA/YrhL